MQGAPLPPLRPRPPGAHWALQLRLQVQVCSALMPPPRLKPRHGGSPGARLGPRDPWGWDACALKGRKTQMSLRLANRRPKHSMCAKPPF